MRRSRRSPKMYGQLLLRVLFFGILVVAFQNCGSCQTGGDHYFSSSNVAQLDSGNSGNGEPYEGKPGNYYRLGVDFKCNGKTAVASKIEVSDSQIVAVDTNPHDCTTTEAKLLAADLEGSKLGFGNGQLGFHEGIFELKDVEPNLNDPNLQVSETWCAGSTSANEPIELTVHRRRSDNATSVLMKLGTSTPPPLSGPIAKNLVGDQLSYQGSGVQLTINLAQIAGRIGEKYPARVTASINGRSVNNDLLCRSEVKPKPLCPANYLAVPPLAGFTDNPVCVAKYEMKIMGAANGNQSYSTSSVAEARADGSPWVSLTKAQAVSACRALGPGFDLMRNDEWMALARNLEQVPWNWSNSSIGSAGGISRSYGMSTPVEAAFDENACFNTGTTCDLSTWDAQRRVHRLSTGALIWDVGGNADEWMKDEVSVTYSYEAWSRITAREFLTQWGPFGNYVSLSSIPFGGLGEVLDNVVRGALTRSGRIGPGGVSPVSSGIFSFNAGRTGTEQDYDIGFRCVFRPTEPKNQTLFVESSAFDFNSVADSRQTELGVTFQLSAPGVITAIRFYRVASNPAGYTVNLWSQQGALLATASGPGGSIPGWQEIALPSPVALQANQNYVASYNSSNGQYVERQYGLSLPISRGLDIRAPAKGGVYKLGSGFPNLNYLDSNYYVDVRFKK